MAQMKVTFWASKMLVNLGFKRSKIIKMRIIPNSFVSFWGNILNLKTF